jgi:uncharacterized membrane protein YgcG
MKLNRLIAASIVGFSLLTTSTSAFACEHDSHSWSFFGICSHSFNHHDNDDHDRDHNRDHNGDNKCNHGGSTGGSTSGGGSSTGSGGTTTPPVGPKG